MSLTSKFAAFVLVFLPCLSFAQDIVLDPVVITGTKQRSVPYKESYELAKKVHAATQGRVVLGIKLFAARAGVSMNDISLWLDGADESLPVHVGEGGVFTVPINDRIAEAHGAYAINKKKGDVGAKLIILPGVPPSEWTVGLMRDVISDAAKVLPQLVPWYLRAVAGRVTSVSVCTRETGAAIALQSGETVVGTFNTEAAAVNEAGQKVFCHHFKPDDTLDRALRVVIPSDAEVLLL